MKRRASADVPDELPRSAIRYWPDLGRWPTASDVDDFLRSTRRRPEPRLAVLTGLRRYVVVELNTLWAVAAVFFALFTAMIAALPPGVLTAAAMVFGAAIAILFLARLMSETARVDERRRAAVAWLHAFEDGIRAERRSVLGR